MRFITVCALSVVTVIGMSTSAWSVPSDEPSPPAIGEEAPVPDAAQSANTGTGLSGQVANLQGGAAPPAPNTGAKQILASTDGEQSGVTADITELKRISGDLLMLKFTMNNGSDEQIDFGFTYIEPGTNDFANVSGTNLIDGSNKKKYLVLRDSNKKCVCSSGLKVIPPGGKLNLWAKFPAPPTNVNKLSVQIPHFIPVDDVPIS